MRRHTNPERFMSQEELESNNDTVHAAVLSAIEYVILNTSDETAGKDDGIRLDL